MAHKKINYNNGVKEIADLRQNTSLTSKALNLMSNLLNEVNEKLVHHCGNSSKEDLKMQLGVAVDAVDALFPGETSRLAHNAGETFLSRYQRGVLHCDFSANGKVKAKASTSSSKASTSKERPVAVVKKQSAAAAPKEKKAPPPKTPKAKTPTVKKSTTKKPTALTRSASLRRASIREKRIDFRPGVEGISKRMGHKPLEVKTLDLISELLNDLNERLVERCLRDSTSPVETIREGVAIDAVEEIFPGDTAIHAHVTGDSALTDFRLGRMVYENNMAMNGSRKLIKPSTSKLKAAAAVAAKKSTSKRAAAGKSSSSSLSSSSSSSLSPSPSSSSEGAPARKASSSKSKVAVKSKSKVAVKSKSKVAVKASASKSRSSSAETVAAEDSEEELVEDVAFVFQTIVPNSNPDPAVSGGVGRALHGLSAHVIQEAQQAAGADPAGKIGPDLVERALEGALPRLMKAHAMQEGSRSSDRRRSPVPKATVGRGNTAAASRKASRTAAAPGRKASVTASRKALVAASRKPSVAVGRKASVAVSRKSSVAVGRKASVAAAGTQRRQSLKRSSSSAAGSTADSDDERSSSSSGEDVEQGAPARKRARIIPEDVVEDLDKTLREGIKSVALMCRTAPTRDAATQIAVRMQSLLERLGDYLAQVQPPVKPEHLQQFVEENFPRDLAELGVAEMNKAVVNAQALRK